jgi:phenylalanyl-tRNA synthetase alpha chain
VSAPELLSELEGLVGECLSRLDQAATFEDLEEVRVAYLGRKGRLAQAMSLLPSLSADERRQAGQAANGPRRPFPSATTRGWPTCHGPGTRPFWRPSIPPCRTDPVRRQPPPGEHRHRRHLPGLRGPGYDIVAGPEIETDYYNFEALNMPPEHPARDMQDTLYFSDSIVLRTHTSPLQVRTMLSKKPPVPWWPRQGLPPRLGPDPHPHVPPD